jgi:hypothetical protein
VHGLSRWPRRWPLAGLAAALVLVAVSAVGVSGGRIHVHSRWQTGIHRFTWGAKIEAMKPPPERPRLKAE